MLEIMEEEAVIDDELKNKIKMICKFYNLKPIFKNGKIRKISKTNLAYIEPHIVIIKDIEFLVFNNEEIYLDNLKCKINFKILDEILRVLAL